MPHSAAFVCAHAIRLSCSDKARSPSFHIIGTAAEELPTRGSVVSVQNTTKESNVSNAHARIKLMGAGLCLIAAGTAAPAVSFAQQNNADPAFQTALAAPLSSLKEAQDTFAKEPGMVSAMPGGSFAPREKARAALGLVKANLLQVINSDKIPRDLAADSLNAIQDAEAALRTDGAQTIAYSLETVRQEISAI